MEPLLQKTMVDLYKMSNEELKELQRSLGQHLGTPQEDEAKRLNMRIRWEIDRRCSYGF